MKFFLKIMIISILNISAISSYSKTIIVEDENEINVNVNTDAGTILQFPESISSITSSKKFKIKPVALNPNQVSGNLTDVSEFEIEVLDKKTSNQENVTFILASKKSLNIKFIQNKYAEKYYNIKLKKYQNDISNAFDLRYDINNFLSTETKLIKSMLQDSDDRFKRTVVNKDVDLSPYDKMISIKLVRVFQGANLFGYTFTFKNKSNKTIYIAPQHLAIGNPNRAIMEQSDRYKLTSCSENKRECETSVRYVVREKDYKSNDISLELPDSKMPFIISNSIKKEN